MELHEVWNGYRRRVWFYECLVQSRITCSLRRLAHKPLEESEKSDATRSICLAFHRRSLTFAGCNKVILTFTMVFAVVIT